MKKSTKSLWIYAAVLFIIAIGLIFTATILQARLIDDGDGIEVLGTFTKNTRQNIENLTNENIRLTNELAEQNKKNESLQSDYNTLKEQNDKTLQTKELVKQMYDLYSKKDYKALEPLLSQITAEEADEFLPGFYETAKKAVDTNKKD